MSSQASQQAKPGQMSREHKLNIRTPHCGHAHLSSANMTGRSLSQDIDDGFRPLPCGSILSEAVAEKRSIVISGSPTSEFQQHPTRTQTKYSKTSRWSCKQSREILSARNPNRSMLAKCYRCGNAHKPNANTTL